MATSAARDLSAGSNVRRTSVACFVCLLLGLAALPQAAAQDREPVLPVDELKRLSVEELMRLEVTSVSRRPERLAETASAIQVITREDIARSGATNLAEALHLAANLHVARYNAFAWIVSARGFNNVFANKLLVMIDGRVVYTPLFAGVTWDVQNVLLEDVERIEVVSGPGGALWGANAVNGVINVVTRSADDTQGLYASAAAGSALRGWGALRYGARLGERLSLRLYAQHFDRDATPLPDGAENADDWRLSQGGFRMDWHASEADVVTLQGDAYTGKEQTDPRASPMNGQNVMTTWTHFFSAESELVLQVFFDHTWRRDVPSTLTDELATLDFDFQHRFPLGRRHSIMWGAGYRLMRSDVENATGFVAFRPNERSMTLFSGFVQDEVALVPDRLRLTVGTKLERNVFSGFEVQPSARLAWTPGAVQTIWGSVSRAVRAPSRIDVDYFIPAEPPPPDRPSVAGGPSFDSEKLVAFELGYRVQPTAGLSLSLAAFYNRYDDLYSVEALPGTVTFHIQNGSEGETRGAELSGTFQPAAWWRLRGGYTYFHSDLRTEPGRIYDTTLLGADPQHQLVLQSMLDLPGRLQLDFVARYVDARAGAGLPRVPPFFTFDARLGWRLGAFEASVVGQNLWEERHAEFGTLPVPRSVYGRLTWRH